MSMLTDKESLAADGGWKVMVPLKNSPPQTSSGAPTLEAFLEKWRAELRQPSRFWEGIQACTDLRRTGFLQRVRLEERGASSLDSGLEHFVPEHAIPKICKILHSYRRDLKKVRALINSQKFQEDWLAQKARAFRKKSKQVSDNELAHDLMHLAEKVDEVIVGTRLRLNDRWHNQLGLVLPFKERGVPLQERQLDSRFQVHLAAIFRTFMQADRLDEPPSSGPTRRTIARLIVLFLVCADLAEIDEDQVKLKHNNRRVTVGGVLQQLSSANISKGMLA